MTDGAGLLEGKQLLRTERFVVDLRRRFDQVLQMRPGEEVAEVDKLAVRLILDVDDSPSVLAASDLFAADHNGFFRADDCKWDDVLDQLASKFIGIACSAPTYLDRRIERNLLLVMLLVVIWIHLEVVELELLLYPLFERRTLLQSQGVALRNDRYYIYEFREFLEHDNVNRLKGMSAWLDEEQAAVDPRILQISFALSSQLLAQVSAVLVFDVFDDWIPAALVVDQIAVTRRVDNVEA